MNIAFVIPSISERFGGPVSMVRNVGTLLTGTGNTVSYWAPGTEFDKKELTNQESANIFDLSWPRTWYRAKQLGPELTKEAHNIDIMHINGFWSHPVFVGHKVARRSSTPFILRPAGSFEPWRLKNTPVKWLKKKIYINSLGKNIIRDAACLHAASEAEARNFRLMGYRGPVTIIPNGINPDFFSIGNEEDAEDQWPIIKGRQVVLFMSRLSPEKGLDQLIPAWANIVKRREFRDALLVISGPDDRGYQKTVIDMIECFALERNILVTGMVWGQSKVDLYRRADIFVLPSYSENFGIVVIEALACGTPVVTTTGTPWKQLDSFGIGRCVLPTSKSLEEAMLDLLRMSQSERRKMGEAGSQYVHRNFTWENASKRLIEVYRAILDGRQISIDTPDQEA